VNGSSYFSMGSYGMEHMLAREEDIMQWDSIQAKK
jgi:hypothetical protein